MTTSSNLPGLPPATGACASEIVRLWKDTDRLEQVARINGLHLQSCDREGQKAWEQASLLHAQMPAGVRVDLPSPRVFARVLGFYRSAAALKHRPMLEFEMSVQDIAAAVGYSKSAVEAALRWLGGDAIEYKGMLVARGLGYIDRTRRKARAFVRGVLKNVYRTTQTALTLLGRAFLGLGELLSRVGRALTGARSRKKASAPQPQAESHREANLERHSEAGLHEVRNIMKQLRV
jgi:hypothetical protein